MKKVLRSGEAISKIFGDTATECSEQRRGCHAEAACTTESRVLDENPRAGRIGCKHNATFFENTIGKCGESGTAGRFVGSQRHRPANYVRAGRKIRPNVA
jgi:hypothetical protein